MSLRAGSLRLPRPPRLQRVTRLPRLGRAGTTLGTVVVALGLTASTAVADELGVDVSHYQHNPSISWPAVAGEGVSFAFIKATEGVGYTNSYLAADWKASAAAGIYRGAYHFARPDTRTGDAAAEARYFVSVAGTQHAAGDLPPVLDLETTGGLSVAALTAWTKTWLRTVEGLTGRTPIIYVSPSFWETNLGNSRDFTHYPLWVAHYGVASPRVPGGWPTWTFWQGTSTGRVTGITGNVDMNAFHGSLSELRALALAGDAAPAPQPPTPPTAPTHTTSSLTTSRAAVYAGRNVELTGTLTDPDGTGVRRRPLAVQTRAPGGAWATAVQVTTDADGAWTATLPVTTASRFRTTFAGGRRYAASTSPVATVALRAPAATVADLTAERPTVTEGGSSRLYGHLRTTAGAAVAGRSLTIYARRPGTTDWHQVGTATSVAPTGWYQFTATPTRTTVYRAVYGGGRRYVGDTSNRVRVTLG